MTTNWTDTEIVPVSRRYVVGPGGDYGERDNKYRQAASSQPSRVRPGASCWRSDRRSGMGGIPRVWRNDRGGWAADSGDTDGESLRTLGRQTARELHGEKANCGRGERIGEWADAALARG